MRKITKELMFELILQSVPRDFEEGVQIDRLNKPPITRKNSLYRRDSQHSKN